MSDIPPDRRSSYELYEQFRAAGERKARVRRQVRRRTWLQQVPGPVLGAVAAFLVVGGGLAVGTKVFVADQPGVRHAAHTGRDVSGAPADRRVAQAVAADPEIAGARWGMRVIANDRGETCALAGRLVGGRVGRVTGGRFRAYPDEVVANCVDLPRAHAEIALRGDMVDNAPRTLLFGLADRTVTRVGLVSHGGTRPVALAPDGSYLLVRRGARAFAGQKLRVSRGSASKDYMLQPAR